LGPIARKSSIVPKAVLGGVFHRKEAGASAPALWFSVDRRFQAWNFLRIKPASPTIPVPNIKRVPGSGVDTVCAKLNEIPSVSGGKLDGNPVIGSVLMKAPVMLHSVNWPPLGLTVQK
jgi:hypothetical protein